ncbi:hypothetical protein V8E52_008134 [Russula decolorans]
MSLNEGVPILPISPTSSSFFYSALDGTEVGDDLLNSCAKLFSTNYGIWDEKAPTISKFTKPGQRVKMTGKKLKSQCLSVPEKTVLVTCFKHTQLVGHAFTTVWRFNGGVVGWVTQLVVDASFRKRYIATLLLQTLKTHPLFYNITAIGLVSSHPVACGALSKYANVKVNAIDTNFISQHAQEIFSVTPIEYLKNIKLRGNLFENCSSDIVSCAYTEFYVDHNEPLEALKVFRIQG